MELTVTIWCQGKWLKIRTVIPWPNSWIFPVTSYKILERSMPLKISWSTQMAYFLKISMLKTKLFKFYTQVCSTIWIWIRVEAMKQLLICQSKMIITKDPTPLQERHFTNQELAFLKTKMQPQLQAWAKIREKSIKELWRGTCSSNRRQI